MMKSKISKSIIAPLRASVLAALLTSQSPSYGGTLKWVGLGSPSTQWNVAANWQWVEPGITDPTVLPPPRIS
ncbi:MAG: hypothetical protein WDN28_09980 [Chthoniobacter sp.]